jgi:hypothetical protein
MMKNFTIISKNFGNLHRTKLKIETWYSWVWTTKPLVVFAKETG